MCAVSAVIDNVTRPYLGVGTLPYMGMTEPAWRAELEIMRRQFQLEIDELRKLLPAVQEYDRATGQPDCESDEKLKLLRGIANRLGVNVEGIA